MSAEKKNALIIAYNDLNNSGVPNVIYQTVKALHNEYNFDIVVFGDNYFYLKRLNVDGIKNVNVVKINENKPNKKISRFFWHLWKRNQNNYIESSRLFSQKHYDVIHSFREYLSWPFLKAGKKHNIPIRIVHSNVIHSNKSNIILRLIDKLQKNKTLKYATKLIGVSNSCAIVAFGSHRYSVVYNGYDEDRYNMSVPNNLVDEELVLTHVASFNSNKNQLFSLEVLRALLDKYPCAKLKLVGKETEDGYLKKIIKYIDTYNLNNNVEIIDGTNGIGNVLSCTTFTLLPSHKEGAGIVTIESQACGIKVYASNGVSKEMDAGGLARLDLSEGSAYWANIIFEDFKQIGNQRFNYDTSRFSNNSFKQSIAKIYNND